MLLELDVVGLLYGVSKNLMPYAALSYNVTLGMMHPNGGILS